MIAPTYSAVAHEELSVTARSIALNAASYSLPRSAITNPATASAVASSVPPSTAACACRSPAVLSASSNPSRVKHHKTPRDVRVGGGVVGIKFQRVFEELHCRRGVRGHLRRHVRQRAQIEVVGVQVVWPLSPRAFDLATCTFGRRLRRLSRLSVLQIEHVFDRAVEPSARGARRSQLR